MPPKKTAPKKKKVAPVKEIITELITLEEPAPEPEHQQEPPQTQVPPQVPLQQQEPLQPQVPQQEPLQEPSKETILVQWTHDGENLSLHHTIKPTDTIMSAVEAICMTFGIELEVCEVRVDDVLVCTPVSTPPLKDEITTWAMMDSETGKFQVDIISLIGIRVLDHLRNEVCTLCFPLDSRKNDVLKKLVEIEEIDHEITGFWVNRVKLLPTNDARWIEPDERGTVFEVLALNDKMVVRFYTQPGHMFAIKIMRHYELNLAIKKFVEDAKEDRTKLRFLNDGNQLDPKKLVDYFVSKNRQGESQDEFDIDVMKLQDGGARKRGRDCNLLIANKDPKFE